VNRFEVVTGDPPPKKRYLVHYRTRSSVFAEAWGEPQQVEIIERSQEAAETVALNMRTNAKLEGAIVSCKDITGE